MAFHPKARRQRPRLAGLRARALGLLAALTLALATPALAETRTALVIGNSGYAVSPLSNPRNDAELMARTLRGVGFQVTKLVDGDQKAMRQAILEFGRRLRGTDSIGVFYYAGHGVQVAGENFLIPVGADIKDESEVAIEGVSLTELLKTMERSATRINIAILDACRNNPFESATRSGARGLAPVSAPSGTLIAYATAPGHVALDGEGINSPYSTALAATIPLPGIPLEDVFRRTRRQVLAATGGKQTPWEHSSLTGEFIFKAKAAEPEASARPPGTLTTAYLDEIAAWERIKESRDAATLAKFLEQYPAGIFAELARLRLDGLRKEPAGGGVAGWLGNVFGVTRGDAEAEAAYERGLRLDTAGRDEDMKEAHRLFKEAAERGLPAAMHQLARTYDHGRGVERSPTEARKWYRKAADLDHVPAMASLGTMYELGEGGDADLAEALRLYQLAAEGGDPFGMSGVAYLHHQGKGVGRDFKTARTWYATAADKGSPRAMYNLALMHIRAEGAPPDFSAAAVLLKRAVEKGHMAAARELAYLHDEGRGVPRDPKIAGHLLMQAFVAGNGDARADLLQRPDAWSLATRRVIQQNLTDRGLYRGRILGYFDAKTRRALEELAKQP